MGRLNRESFGTGQAGQRAWEIITDPQEGCTAKLKNGGLCGKPPRMTVDYDVLGELEQQPVCSKNHQKLVRRKVALDLGKSENDATFGINGRGRA